jgi:membrane-bound lytic murein transglycosylase D
MGVALVLGTTLAGCAGTTPAPERSDAPAIGRSEASLPGFPHHRPSSSLQRQRSAATIWPRLLEGFGLPELDTPQVEREIAWYTAHPLYLEAVWTRAERYLHYILGEVERRRMPSELALLPAVESGFRPQALSPSTAAGLWQFVPGTAAHLGLARDEWVDQRMDVVRGTRAALDYLQSLHASFGGDWLLTLAAYNGGPGYLGRLQEANARRGRGTAFEDLPLRAESETYVWRMLALRRLIENPGRYGITLPPILDAPYFATVELGHQIDLDALAALDELSTEELIALNPGLRRGVTHPQGPHRVLVPWRVADAVQSRFAVAAAPVMPWPRKGTPAPATRTLAYTVRRGDTLAAIARRHGTSVGALQRQNGLRGTLLHPGQHIAIPTAGTPTDAPNRCPATHTVRSGESLWTVARDRRVGMSALQACNAGIASAALRPGQVLRLPGTAVSPPRRVTYRVRPGDTLTRISASLGVQLKDLLAWNADLQPARILRAGENLSLLLAD